jgi:hypothetical protein
MNVKTVYFNSDGDYLPLTYQNLRVLRKTGLDEINTNPRLHLMNAILPHKLIYLLSVLSLPYRIIDASGNICQPPYRGDFVVNGPGSGYFKSDEKITNAPYISRWVSPELISLWKANVDQIFRILTGHSFEDDKNRPDDFEIERLTEKLPNDWILRQFNPNIFKRILVAPAPLAFPDTRLNLVGWGRGAVSCHMLANLLKNDSEFCNVPINILAIDPVTGTSNPELDQITLGSNVREYVGFYARDERSSNLHCIVPDTASTTLVHIYPIAGRHTTLIGNQASDGENKPGTFTAPSELVFFLSQECLSRWGAEFGYSDREGYDNLNLFNKGNEVLARIKSEYDDYVVMRNTTYSNQSHEVKNDRAIILNGQLTNFKSAQGARFTPSLGLAKGHIEDMAYFKDIL